MLQTPVRSQRCSVWSLTKNSWRLNAEKFFFYINIILRLIHLKQIFCHDESIRSSIVAIICELSDGSWPLCWPLSVNNGADRSLDLILCGPLSRVAFVSAFRTYSAPIQNETVFRIPLIALIAQTNEPTAIAWEVWGNDVPMRFTYFFEAQYRTVSSCGLLYVTRFYFPVYHMKWSRGLRLPAFFHVVMNKRTTRADCWMGFTCVRISVSTTTSRMGIVHDTGSGRNKQLK